MCACTRARRNVHWTFAVSRACVRCYSFGKIYVFLNTGDPDSYRDWVWAGSWPQKVSSSGMRKKTIIIIAALVHFVFSCKDRPVEIHEGYLTLSNGRVNTLTFDTRKNLYEFYKSLSADYCTRINMRKYPTTDKQFTCYNDDWCKDTIFIYSNEHTCVPESGEKYTNVYMTFADKKGYDILKTKKMNYTELKKYFNDLYVRTAK